MADYYYWSGATGANDGSSEADAWTDLTTALSGLTAGSTLYLKSPTDGSRDTFTASYVNLYIIGTVDTMTVFEGYKDTPGDGGPYLGAGSLRSPSANNDSIIIKYLDIENTNVNYQPFNIAGCILYRCKANAVLGSNMSAAFMGDGACIVDCTLIASTTSNPVARINRGFCVNSYIEQNGDGDGLNIEIGYRAGTGTGNLIVTTSATNTGSGIYFSGTNNIGNDASALNNTIVGFANGINIANGIGAGSYNQIINYGNIISDCGYGIVNSQSAAVTENSVSAYSNAFYNTTSSNYLNIATKGQVDDVQLTASPFEDTTYYQVNDTSGGGDLIKGLLGAPNIVDGPTFEDRKSFNTYGGVVPSPFGSGGGSTAEYVTVF